MAVFRYLFYGLTLRSNARLSDFPLDEESPRTPDCELHLGVKPGAVTDAGNAILSYTSAFTDGSGAPALRIWKIEGGEYLRLDYSDGHQFWLDRKGAQVWAMWPESSTAEEAISYLLGPVLGIVLRHRGVVCLHASAVAIHGRAVVFVGPPGAGKSTTAAAMARCGCRVLADDITVLEERDGIFRVHPAYPGLCLWPDSISLLYGNSGLPAEPVASREKRCLSTGEGLQFEQHALPLGSIYFLDYRNSHEVTSMSEAPLQEALLLLVANTYGSNILSIQMRAHEFGVLGRIAGRIPVRKLHSRRGAAELNSCCDLILANRHFAGQ